MSIVGAAPVVRSRLIPSPSWLDAYPALALRDFRLLMLGLLVSSMGGWVQRIAQDWLVLTMTGSATSVGLVTALQFLPTLLFGLYAGQLADRLPKRSILLVTQTCLAFVALTLAALTLLGTLEVWHVYLLAFVSGAIVAVDNPTRQALVGEVATAREMRSAIGLMSSGFQVGGMAGPVIGGVLMATVGPGPAFLVNAITFIAPTAALLAMRLGSRPDEPRPTGTAGEEADSAVAGDTPDEHGIRTALHYAAAAPTVLWPVVMVGTFGVFTVSLPVTLAAFAKSEFHSGPGGLGLLNGILALGALVGALTNAGRTRRLRLRAVGGSAAALALAMVMASTVGNQWAFAALLAAVGAANLTFINCAQSLIQLSVPSELRGRIVGLYMLVLVGSGAVGGPLVGWLAQTHGPRVAMLVSGAVPALVTLFVCRHLAHVARLRMTITPVTVTLPRLQMVTRH